MREFVLVPSKGNIFNSPETINIYYEEEHKNLRSQIKLLEDKGFVKDITFNDVPRYRMTEEFVNLVKKEIT